MQSHSKIPRAILTVLSSRKTFSVAHCSISLYFDSTDDDLHYIYYSYSWSRQVVYVEEFSMRVCMCVCPSCVFTAFIVRIFRLVQFSRRISIVQSRARFITCLVRYLLLHLLIVKYMCSFLEVLNEFRTHTHTNTLCVFNMYFHISRKADLVQFC